MAFTHNTVRLLVVLGSMFAFSTSLTGCTHMVTFTAPGVDSVKDVNPEKGTAAIGKTKDNRPADTEIFVFSNPPHTWIYRCDEKPEQLVRELLKEGLRRHGIIESERLAPAFVVTVDIDEFSGHNTRGFWYVGNCFFTIRCLVKIKGAGVDKSLTIVGNGNNKVGRLTDANMDKLMRAAYEDFLKNFEKALRDAGF